MAPPPSPPLPISERQKKLLEKYESKRDSAQHIVKHIKTVLRATQGESNFSTTKLIGVTPKTVKTWRYRWQDAYPTLVDYVCEKFHKVTDEKICGIFNKSQLNKNFLKTSLATIVVTSLMSYHTYGQEVDIEIEEEEEIEVVDDEIFFGSIIGQNAEPIGGYLKFYEVLTKEIKYFKRLKKYGKVWVQFSIDTTGKMSDFKVVKGLEKKADKEAIRALKAIDYPFTPSKQRGKKVKSRMIVPINFKKDISQSPPNTPSNE